MPNIDRLNQLLYTLITKEGVVASRHNNILFFRSSTEIPRQNYLYGMSLVFVLSGYKRGYLNDQVMTYDSDHILIMATELAFDCQGFIDEAGKLQGIILQLDIALIQTILSNCLTENRQSENRVDIGAKTINSSQEIKGALERLLQTLQDDFQTTFLADGIIREILYAVMRDSAMDFLSGYANYDNYFYRVSRTLRIIHENLRDVGAVESLAQSANMSLSTYYRAFKKITGQTPNQYIKNVRLIKAKNLIENERWKVGAAAHEVGYDNFSQFSREFKQKYKISPSTLVNPDKLGKPDKAQK